MGKFKVGDRVRRTVLSDWPKQYGVVGEEYTVLEVTSSGNLTVIPGGEGAMSSCFELIPAAPLTIVEGRYYRTRDGRKVGPAYIRGGTTTFGGSGNWASAVWTDNGRQASREDLVTETPNDIIAEWVDEPAQPAQPAEPATDEAVPATKFKAGDVVRRAGVPKSESRLRITEVVSEDNYTVEWIVGGPGSTHRWRAYELELATTTAPANDNDTRPLIKTPNAYGFELARFGNYVWVDIGQKSPITVLATNIQATNVKAA